MVINEKQESFIIDLSRNIRIEVQRFISNNFAEHYPEEIINVVVSSHLSSLFTILSYLSDHYEIKSLSEDISEVINSIISALASTGADTKLIINKDH